MKTTAFSPATISAGTILSNYDRKIEGPSSPSNASYGAFGAGAILTGEKKFFEIIVGTMPSTGALIGIANASLFATANLSADANGLAVYSSTGAVISNGSNIATPGLTFSAANDVIDVAVDRVHNKVWFRKNGGNWNGSGTDNPATNTGGISIPGGLGSGAFYPAVVAKTVSGTITRLACNFGTSAYSYAKPSGFSDIGPGTDADYINGLMAAAVVNRSYHVVLPVQRFDLTEQLVAPKGVVLEGSGRMHHSYPNTDLPDGVATVLDVNWGSGGGTSGDNTKVALLLGLAAEARNLAFCYPGQVPSANPTEWGSTIAPNAAELSWDQKVENCFFQKAYVAVDFRGSKAGNQGVGSCVIRDCRGAPISAGVWIDFVTDWTTLSGCQFNSPWADPFQPPGNLLTWIAANGIAYRLDGNDWLTLDSCSAFGYYLGAIVQPGVGYGGTGPYRIQDCNFDQCACGMLLNNTATYAHNVTVSRCNFVARNWVTGGFDFPIRLGALTANAGIVIENIYAFASNVGVIDASPATYNQLTVTDCMAKDGTGGAAIPTGTGPLAQSGNNFQGFV